MFRRAIILAALGVMALPAVAQAHHVSSKDVTCTEATFSFVSDTQTTVSYQLVVNGQTVVNQSQPGAATGTIHVPYTAPAGSFTVTLNVQFSTGETDTLTKTLMCSQTPPAIAPPVSPPAGGPTPVTTPVTTPATPKKNKSRNARKPTKLCIHGRRHLKNKAGRRFSVCRKFKRPNARPNFTG